MLVKKAKEIYEETAAEGPATGGGSGGGKKGKA